MLVLFVPVPDHFLPQVYLTTLLLIYDLPISVPGVCILCSNQMLPRFDFCFVSYLE